MDTPRPSAGKRLLFQLVAVGSICLLGMYGLEAMLRWNQSRIDRSEVLEPGAIQYDADLGWKLTPGWSGGHRHHDFSARYTINELGFRADTPSPPARKDGRLSVVVGDSFTFGFGVNDQETFVHHLHAGANKLGSFFNGAIPGFSTDQEALLIEQKIVALRPTRILLAVYVGNDLLDNPLPIPMQVGSPKPYFEVMGDALVLRNSPVPTNPGAVRAAPRGLMANVLGPERAHWRWKARIEHRSALFRTVGQAILPELDYTAEFSERFAPAARLFGLILDRIAATCEREKIELMVVALAGRSYFQRPSSVSAQYQDYFLQQVAAHCRQKRITLIDVVAGQRTRYAAEGQPWFFPNEGHLTAAGHRVVAEIIATELGRLEGRPRP